jgi:ribosomal protein S18 acetylase RimI-like enzyme
MTFLSPSLVEKCRENLVGRHEFVARIVPGGSVERIGGLPAVRSGMRGARFNAVFAFDRPSSLAEVRDGIERMFVRTNTDFHVVTLADASGEVERFLRAMNLTEKDVVPGMVLDPIPGGRHVPPEGLEILKAGSPEDVAVLLRTGEAGLGVPSGRFDVWEHGLLSGAMTWRSRVENYVGYALGVPAATSMVFTTGGVAGIYFVSTLPGFRRRGFGEAMTWRAVEDGRDAGCKSSFLQASEMGRRVYERMGFRFLEEYWEWRRALPEERSGSPGATRP